MASLREKIEEKLKEALRDRNDIGEIIVASDDGLTIASTLDEHSSSNADTISAYSTQIVNQVKSILAELGLSSPRFISIKTIDGTELDIYVKEKKVIVYIKPPT